MSTTEATICDPCRMIPLAHLELDVPMPIVGWEATLAARGVQIELDDIGRPCVPRRLLGELLAERRKSEAERAARPRPERAPVPGGVPAIEGGSPLEAMQASPAYVTAHEELGGRVSPAQEFIDSHFGQAREREEAARIELVRQAEDVLSGRPRKKSRK